MFREFFSIPSASEISAGKFYHGFLSAMPIGIISEIVPVVHSKIPSGVLQGFLFTNFTEIFPSR